MSSDLPIDNDRFTVSRISATWVPNKKTKPKDHYHGLEDLPEPIREALTVDGLAPHARLVLIFIRACKLPAKFATIPFLSKATGLSSNQVGFAFQQLQKANLLKASDSASIKEIK